MTPRDRKWTFIAAALCWLCFALIAALVESGRGAAFDAAGLELWRHGPAAQPRGPAWLLEAARDFTALGGPLLRNLFALAGLVALLFLGERRKAARLGGTVIGGWLVDVGLKALVGRERPTVVPRLMAVTGSSFPSGHSFNGAVVYIALPLVFSGFTSRRSVRWTIVSAAVVVTLLIALTRVWLGVHFPTDAIAGWLGGAGWAFLAAALVPPRPGAAPRDR